MDFEIREMQSDDAARILEIFRQGIEGGNATFDKEVPSWEFWDKKFFKVCRWVLEDENGVVQAWAAIQPVSARDCFSGVAEVSIYLSNDIQGKGLGEIMLKKLVLSSEENGFWMLQSGIFPENLAIIRVHQKLGFREVGYREKIAEMNGKWRDIILMERRSNKL